MTHTKWILLLLVEKLKEGKYCDVFINLSISIFSEEKPEFFPLY